MPSQGSAVAAGPQKATLGAKIWRATSERFRYKVKQVCAGVGGAETGTGAHVARQRRSPRRTHWLHSAREKHSRRRHATANKCSTGLLHLH